MSCLEFAVRIKQIQVWIWLFWWLRLEVVWRFLLDIIIWPSWWILRGILTQVEDSEVMSYLIWYFIMGYLNICITYAVRLDTSVWVYNCVSAVGQNSEYFIQLRFSAHKHCKMCIMTKRQESQISNFALKLHFLRNTVRNEYTAKGWMSASYVICIKFYKVVVKKIV
jgi:hypothetical protein